jgi:hypothetical protein
MQRSINNLVGYGINAKDGKLGKVNEFYFDDITWSIRYLVVETGNRSSERKVLIPRAALGITDWKSRNFHVNLTIKQVNNSPNIDADKIISRQKERELFNHYGLQYYWENGFYYRPIQIDSFTNIANKKTVKKEDDFTQEFYKDQHMRSTNKVKGYYIHANDGEIGHVEDYIVDDEKWNLCFLIVDTHNWQPGKKVLILPRWINRIDSNESKVYLNLSQESIKNIPEFDPSQPIGTNYETELFNDYRDMQIRVDKTGLFLIEK